MQYFWIILISLIILGVVGLICAYLINRQVKSFSRHKIKLTIDEIPDEEPPQIAIVYGAKIYENGEPSSILYDRVLTAVELYQAGKVKKLLLSGDNSQKDYDEPAAMKKTAVNLGVFEEDIITDGKGRRTFETCYRAKNVFDVEKAIHVTQEFHLPRAIYLAEKIGIESIGLIANRRTYLNEKAWSRREFFAVVKAWFEINFFPLNKPIEGKKEPIQ